MRKPRTIETAEERDERLEREARMKKAEIAAADEAVDRAIRRNLEQHGP